MVDAGNMTKIMNVIQAFCTACGEDTCFAYDGEDWVCRSCGRFNTQGSHDEPEAPYADEDWNAL